VSEFAAGLVHPWGLVLLPNGDALVTERPGRLRRITAAGELSEPLAGTPEVFAQGQGGLLDVELDPEFQENRRIWLSYARPGENGTASTALGHGRLTDGRIENFETVFVMRPTVEGPNHFGSRIVFTPEGLIFLTLGERYKFEPAQDLSSHLGSVVRITREGEAPPDNPFVDRENAEPEIWSYGHRNIQAAAMDPATGNLWVAEMGPLGGDELNLVERGGNYGWPVVSWGIHYDGEPIPDPTTRPEFADATLVWTPVLAPSGMIFYQGDAFPEFQGDMFIGGLVSEGLTHVTVEGTTATEREHIPLSVRIRDVAEGPDGAIYVAIDQEDGAIWKLAPLDE
jgi:glucose/arabinose dehydrogenase